MRKHHRSFEGEIGSILYRIIYLGLLFLGIKFFGLSIFDDIIFAIFGAIAFEATGFILRKTGFWRY